MDSDPDPKQEMHLNKNHLKSSKNKQFDTYDIKNVYLTFSLKSTGTVMLYNTMKKPVLLLAL
jgi:hypothetical protein